MQYDEEEYLTGGLITSREDWARLLASRYPCHLPTSARGPFISSPNIPRSRWSAPPSNCAGVEPSFRWNR